MDSRRVRASLTSARRDPPQLTVETVRFSAPLITETTARVSTFSSASAMSSHEKPESTSSASKLKNARCVGDAVGSGLGSGVGSGDGIYDGNGVGDKDGVAVGTLVGVWVGAGDGNLVGKLDGRAVGSFEGSGLGTYLSHRNHHHYISPVSLKNARAFRSNKRRQPSARTIA